ncbi:15076_t:CDS:2, partial [Funneliformis geosporum]
MTYEEIKTELNDAKTGLEKVEEELKKFAEGWEGQRLKVLFGGGKENSEGEFDYLKEEQKRLEESKKRAEDRIDNWGELYRKELSKRGDVKLLDK